MQYLLHAWLFSGLSVLFPKPESSPLCAQCCSHPALLVLIPIPAWGAWGCLVPGWGCSHPPWKTDVWVWEDLVTSLGSF